MRLQSVLAKWTEKPQETQEVSLDAASDEELFDFIRSELGRQ